MSTFIFTRIIVAKVLHIIIICNMLGPFFVLRKILLLCPMSIINNTLNFPTALSFSNKNLVHNYRHTFQGHQNKNEKLRTCTKD